ncbi:(2,3-dihydroxybenzoyl)adenylate synthase [Planomonospora venezuelensis]|uniref:2,3-dihydroxybenzoate-AMP ligase n=1 Tax=Planomonospora venezuelensis TaxID=1999 RepID=A0A841CXT1_PLAVE|nr:AMP-binding protein [Planomonospora venezuelensis]MBB5963202.1 2,3-dihydroxybenzoate-AMP ligase [Planomonospora venezuelensis]GIN03921.1 2,3-dihydroxybenzoate-AMP ligase [Planomonospora venezuelensis]
MHWPDDIAARYRAAGYWKGETFGDMLRELAGRYGPRPALIAPPAPDATGGAGTRWSFGDLAERADRLAAGLHGLGIGHGDRVVVQLPNVPEFYQVCFALFRLGALPVFALPAHRSAEISYFCAFTEAAAYVCPDDAHRALAPDTPALVLGDLPEGDPAVLAGLPGPAPGDVAFLQLSGGSTGLPKLIPRTHDDYIYSFRASAEICALTPESVYLCALPAAHNFPMSSPGVFGALSAGAASVLAPDPSPGTCFPLVERERVTITALVPPLALVWLDAAAGTAHDLSSLEVLQVGGAKFSEEAAKRVRPELGCTLQQVFGMAEGLVNYTRLDDPEDVIVSTQGRPISPDDEILIVDDDDRETDEGHLLTRGPYTIRGYWRAEEHNKLAFTADGFYRTGDIVRRTPGGHLVVEGRAKDQINRGGDKIAAEEVENHLLAHPSVHDASVVAVPDPYLGERSCAYLICRGEAPAKAELRAFLRERGIAAFKIPDRFEFVDAFPQTAVGKVSKRHLRERT